MTRYEGDTFVVGTIVLNDETWKVSKSNSSPLEETVYSLSEMQTFDDEVMKTTTVTPKK